MWKITPVTSPPRTAVAMHSAALADGASWCSPIANPGSRRDEVIPVVANIVVAPLTSTIRDIPTCIPVGPDEGVDHESVATFDSLAAVPKSVLTQRLGHLGVDGRRQICQALDALADC